MFVTALLALSLVATAEELKDGTRLGVIQKAPEWRLTDQTGTAVTSGDLKGKVVLVSFVFTTCNGSCPATTHRMEKVQTELKARGLFKEDRVRLLSITLDPERDTPQKLRGYMELYDADPKSWSFLTGPKDTVAKVIAGFGMWVRPAANGQLDHPSRIFLLDRQGQVREIYNLSFLKVAWVAEDIETLLAEKEAVPANCGCGVRHRQDAVADLLGGVRAPDFARRHLVIPHLVTSSIRRP